MQELKNCIENEVSEFAVDRISKLFEIGQQIGQQMDTYKNDKNEKMKRIKGLKN